MYLYLYPTLQKIRSLVPAVWCTYISTPLYRFVWRRRANGTFQRGLYSIIARHSFKVYSMVEWSAMLRRADTSSVPVLFCATSFVMTSLFTYDSSSWWSLNQILTKEVYTSKKYDTVTKDLSPILSSTFGAICFWRRRIFRANQAWLGARYDSSYRNLYKFGFKLSLLRKVLSYQVQIFSKYWCSLLEA